MLEKGFQKIVIKELRDTHKCYVINVEGNRAGTPDLIVCYKGKFIGIELKMGTGYKATALQLAHLKFIQRSGGTGEVLTYSKKWKEELKEILEKI